MEFLELLEEVRGFIPPEYAGVSQAIGDVFPWAVLVVSLLVCFFGHKVHHLWAAVLFCGMGILVGVITGAFLTMTFPGLNLWVSMLPALVLGALGLLFSRRLLKLQLFLVNATLVYAALPSILGRWLPYTAAVLAGLAVAVLVGLLAVRYKYLVTIVTTAVTGALSAVPAVLALAGWESSALRLAAEGVLILGGLAVQFRMEKREREREAAEKEERRVRQKEHG